MFHNITIPPELETMLASHGGFFDRDGQPITLMRWLELMENPEYRTVAYDQEGDVEVSTVWLGCDFSVFSRQPQIFETMLFGPHGLYRNQWRYTKIADATTGHAMALAAVRTMRKEHGASDEQSADPA